MIGKSFPVDQVTLSEGLGKLEGGDPISLLGVFGCMHMHMLFIYESGDTSICECAGMCTGLLTDSERGGSCCSSMLIELIMKTSSGSFSSMGANLKAVCHVQ